MEQNSKKFRFWKRRRKDNKRYLRQAPLHILFSMMENALREQDGSICLKEPVVVFVDEIFGELPLVVRILKHPDGSPKNYGIIEIGEGYTIDDISRNDVLKLVEQI